LLSLSREVFVAHSFSFLEVGEEAVDTSFDLDADITEDVVAEDGFFGLGSTSTVTVSC
jgi:hypothetical protein